MQLVNVYKSSANIFPSRCSLFDWVFFVIKFSQRRSITPRNPLNYHRVIINITIIPQSGQSRFTTSFFFQQYFFRFQIYIFPLLFFCCCFFLHNLAYKYYFGNLLFYFYFHFFFHSVIILVNFVFHFLSRSTLFTHIQDLIHPPYILVSLSLLLLCSGRHVVQRRALEAKEGSVSVSSYDNGNSSNVLLPI